MSKLLCLYLSHKLTGKKPLSDPDKLNNSIRSANIDLNPHQVDAAIFAFKSPLSRGAILADEVGLGKTIEAGLIINQLWVEGRNRILILVPASLRTQWQEELKNRFNLESMILDGSSFRLLQNSSEKSNPLHESNIFIASHNFASRYNVFVKEVPWDLVVIDEAHRMRNVWRKGNKTAKIIRDAIKGKPKVLLTATPLQNNLMELFGLTSFIDENYLGTDFSFRTLFANPVKRQKKTDSLKELKTRLMGSFDRVTGDLKGGILTRTLRIQVKGLIPFTNRFSITEDFAPNDNEMELYNDVSDYLRRPYLASTRATQRNMMELVYRKILASSSFAIAGTLLKIINFLSKRLQQEQHTAYDRVVEIVTNKRLELQIEWQKQLPEIQISKFEPENINEVQEILPGFDDVESTIEKEQEEVQDSDDLGEDSQFDDNTKKSQEREIDHIFTEEEIISELNDVLSYYFLATTISENQKSQALIRILKKVFEYAQKKRWPQKAVIFTESRRTQDHLEKLLSGIGYELVLFNGSNAGKKARGIYEEWAGAFPIESKTASRTINIRKALIWKFRSLDKAILITTEAGAEGLNLQFANIVINYDLPWNPQRVEQRIGRCHRYGQKLDVLVVNFLNKRNYADQRVYELLKEKIKLFGNLFSFSDKVLGTEELTDDGYEVREVALASLGTGIDFERKVLEIYRKCRTENEIEQSFQQLQLELSEIIEEKVEDAQKKVIQHFDAEVREKLNIRRQQMNDSLTKYDLDIKRYLNQHFGGTIRHVTDNIIEYDNKRYIFGDKQFNGNNSVIPVHANLDFIRRALDTDRAIIGSWQVIFEHPKDKERKYFDDSIGKSGQLIIDLLTCSRKTINNQNEIFEKLVASGVIIDGEAWKLLNPDRAIKLLDMQVTQESEAKIIPFERLVEKARNLVEDEKQRIADENEEFVDHEMQLIETFIEESMLRFKKELEERESELKELSKQLSKSGRTIGFYERQQIHDQLDRKQQELFRSQKKYFQAQSVQFADKEKRVGDLKNKLKLRFDVKRLAEVQFKIAA